MGVNEEIDCSMLRERWSDFMQMYANLLDADTLVFVCAHEWLKCCGYNAMVSTIMQMFKTTMMEMFGVT